jgi:ABC-type glycerol-3-phosphate transport system permease component
VRRLRGAGWYLTSIAIAIIFLFPVYWMFAVSLKTPQEIFKRNFLLSAGATA